MYLVILIFRLRIFYNEYKIQMHPHAVLINWVLTAEKFQTFFYYLTYVIYSNFIKNQFILYIHAYGSYNLYCIWYDEYFRILFISEFNNFYEKIFLLQAIAK